MSKIKSTLDLVMERTQNLSLSREEKRELRRKEFEKRLQGLVVQYDDGLLSQEALAKGIESLRSEYEIEDRRPVINALLSRIDLNGDNDRILKFLLKWVPDLHGRIEECLGNYRELRGSLESESISRLRVDLERCHGIKGSAVIPNPWKDREFLKNVDDLRAETMSSIEAL